MKLKHIFENFALKKQQDTTDVSNKYTIIDSGKYMACVVSYPSITKFYDFGEIMYYKDDKQNEKRVNKLIQSVKSISNIKDGMLYAQQLINLNDKNYDLIKSDTLPDDTQNINLILEQYHFEGFSDWYMPTQTELQQIDFSNYSKNTIVYFTPINVHDIKKEIVDEHVKIKFKYNLKRIEKQGNIEDMYSSDVLVNTLLIRQK